MGDDMAIEWSDGVGDLRRAVAFSSRFTEFRPNKYGAKFGRLYPSLPLDTRIDVRLLEETGELLWRATATVFQQNRGVARIAENPVEAVGRLLEALEYSTHNADGRAVFNVAGEWRMNAREGLNIEWESEI